jgi:predicted PurR-regulated permease PerM
MPELPEDRPAVSSWNDSQPPAGGKASIWDWGTARVLVTILTFMAIAAFVFAAWRVIVSFLFAIFLAYLLEPLVSFIERRSPLSKGSRARAIAQVYVAIGIIVAILMAVAGPPLVSEGRKLAEELPVWMDKLTSGQIAWQIGSKRGWSVSTQQHMQHWLSTHRAEIISWSQSLGQYAAQFAVNAVWIILVPILAIFFLRDGGDFVETVVDMVDRRRERQFLRGLIGDLDTMLAQYIRAQLILAALTMAVFTAVLSAIRLPYSVVLGVLGGMLEFIPLVGPIAAAVMILGVAFFTSYHHIIIVAIVLGVWRVIQDYVNAPRIMGRSVELHPLATLFAILAGGELAGVIGVYLSIPIAASMRILWRRWRKYTQGAPKPQLPGATVSQRRSA